ncbi:MAG: leucyl/phenylalanyl-tRNA--protein transferase [Pseudomonadota bacterium]
MSNTRIAWLSPGDPPGAFPSVERALTEPDGLLAAGGDLSAARLIEAYTRGIFPWFDAGQPILWWSPDPRCVLEPAHYHQSRRFLRSLRNSVTEFSFNADFAAVIAGCAAPRQSQPGTWITPDMRDAYAALHDMGWAHSVEVWRQDELVGGLYGLAIGRMFFAESMFSRETGGSKTALTALCRVLEDNAFPLIDCQVASAHLLTLGATLLSRRRYTAAVTENTLEREPFTSWPEGRHPARELAAGTAHQAQ